MKELDAQSLVINIVREYGGNAHKLSNRFLVGVVDLLVKLPQFPAALFEVKLSKFASLDPVFVPDVTVLQHRFLSDYCDAGMPAGVISFIELKHQGIKGLHMAVFMLDKKVTAGYRLGDHVRGDQHQFLGNSAGRAINLLAILKEALSK